MNALRLLCQNVAARFKSDPTVAGVIVAWIEEKEMYYVSVCRYHEPLGRGRQVVARGIHEELETAIASVSSDLEELP